MLYSITKSDMDQCCSDYTSIDSFVKDSIDLIKDKNRKYCGPFHRFIHCGVIDSLYYYGSSFNSSTVSMIGYNGTYVYFKNFIGPNISSLQMSAFSFYGCQVMTSAYFPKCKTIG